MSLLYSPRISADDKPMFNAIRDVKVNVGDDPLWASENYGDDSWDTTPVWKLDPHERIIWVRVEVNAMGGVDLFGQPLAVFMTGPVAAEFWLNGVFIGKNGKPGNSASQEVPGMMSASIFIPPHLIKEGNNVLALRMSSFHQRKKLASPIQSIRVGVFQDPRLQFFDYYMLIFIASGVLFVGAIYFMVMYFSNYKDYANIFLSLLSLSILIHLCAETSRAFITYNYQFHILRLDIMLYSSILSGLFLVSYLTTKYLQKHKIPIVLLSFVAMIFASIAIPGYDSKTTFTILIAIVFSLLISGVKGVNNKNTSAVVVCLLMIFLLILYAFDPGGFIDISYYLGAVVLILALFVQQVISLRQTQQQKHNALLNSSRLELELLKKQLQPHFLLNTLTALSEWIESQPEKGVEMIEALSQEYRILHASSSKTLIPLQEEIALCQHHLQVMSLRKDQSFHLRIEGFDASIQIPPGILHTLIENALSHNNYQSEIEFVLKVVETNKKSCELKLISPRSKETIKEYKEGLGHSYIKARLEEAFGSHWQFSSGTKGKLTWVDEIVFSVA